MYEYCHQCGKASNPVIATGRDSEGEPACSMHTMVEAPSGNEVTSPYCACGKAAGHIGRCKKSDVAKTAAVDVNNRVPEDAGASRNGREDRTGDVETKGKAEQALMERRLALVDALCEILRQLYACDEALRAMGLEIVEE